MRDTLPRAFVKFHRQNVVLSRFWTYFRNVIELILLLKLILT